MIAGKPDINTINSRLAEDSMDYVGSQAVSKDRSLESLMRTLYPMRNLNYDSFPSYPNGCL